MQSLTTEHPEILEVLSTGAAIEKVIGKPSSQVLAKVMNSLDDICRAFIARSPFVVVASSDAFGNLDVSPTGDPAGFLRRSAVRRTGNRGNAGYAVPPPAG